MLLFGERGGDVDEENSQCPLNASPNLSMNIRLFFRLRDDDEMGVIGICTPHDRLVRERVGM